MLIRETWLKCSNLRLQVLPANVFTNWRIRTQLSVNAFCIMAPVNTASVKCTAFYSRCVQMSIAGKYIIHAHKNNKTELRICIRLLNLFSQEWKCFDLFINNDLRDSLSKTSLCFRDCIIKREYRPIWKRRVLNFWAHFIFVSTAVSKSSTR
jgi:hypothetical protein